MKKQLVFERYESKYILSYKAYVALREVIDRHLIPDLFPKSHIVSLYYDTKDYRCIRASIEATNFKEKLRLRKYTSSETENEVFFIEIKRKCEGVVYKRRQLYVPKQGGDVALTRDKLGETQIEKEIDYVFHINPSLSPKALIGYDRLSFKGQDDDQFRLTLDSNIKARFDQLELMDDSTGFDLLPQHQVLMEVKSKYGYPAWFLAFLSAHDIYKQSFSKYGTAYQMKVLGG